ncbi:MAG TPA: P-II family nitrogen regulator [Longimicrobiales bacterium]|nr:P-II family nitrogen regulator [Longimicrobiales bacterium]
MMNMVLAFDTIDEAAPAGARGDGKVYILPVSEALWVKTGGAG